MTKKKAVYKFPIKLPSLNEVINKNRSHWSNGNDLKKDIQNQLMWMIKAQGVKRLNGPVAVILDFYEKDRTRDPDNIYSSQKMILDALKEIGVLKNDGWRDIASITPHHYLSSEVGNFKDYGVIVTLQEV